MTTAPAKSKSRRQQKREAAEKRRVKAKVNKLRNFYVETVTMDEVFTPVDTWKELYREDYDAFCDLRNELRESGWSWAVSGVRFSGFAFDETLDNPGSVCNFLTEKMRKLDLETANLTKSYIDEKIQQ